MGNEIFNWFQENFTKKIPKKKCSLSFLFSKKKKFNFKSIREYKYFYNKDKIKAHNNSINEGAITETSLVEVLVSATPELGSHKIPTGWQDVMTLW